MKKSLYLNGGEVLRVDKVNGKTRFLKVSNDNLAMVQVDYQEFMEFFKSLAYVFATSWDKKLVEEYREFDGFIENLCIK